MRVKTTELSGMALRWAVAVCEGLKPTATHVFNDTWPDGLELEFYDPAGDWNQGGPIIWRESIALRHNKRDNYWLARVDTSSSDMMHWHWFWFGDKNKPAQWKGETPLVAAMRCYVAQVLGNEVEIPEGL